MQHIVICHITLKLRLWCVWCVVKCELKQIQAINLLIFNYSDCKQFLFYKFIWQMYLMSIIVKSLTNDFLKRKKWPLHFIDFDQKVELNWTVNVSCITTLQQFADTRLGCFYVTTILSWGLVGFEMQLKFEQS